MLFLLTHSWTLWFFSYTRCNSKRMRRFYIVQTATFATVLGPRFTAQKIPDEIINETNTVKGNANVINADIVTVRKSPVQVITDSEGCLNNVKLSQSKAEQKINSYKERNEFKAKSVGKFRIIKNFKSISIFGSELTKKCTMHYVQSNEMLRIPSVTHILNQTMSAKHRDALTLWKQNMIKEYGIQSYNLIYKGLLEDGKLFQSFIQNFLMNKKVEIPLRIKSAYSSVEPILSQMQAVHGVKYVIHPLLRYRGFVDCVVSYRGRICVIDWKKSDSPKLSLEETFDAPLKLAAYIGALNAFNDSELTIDRGFIIVAYTSGEPATIHEVSDDTLQTAWHGWLERLKQFYKNRNSEN